MARDSIITTWLPIKNTYNYSIPKKLEIYDLTLLPLAAAKLSKSLGYGMPISLILSGLAFTVYLFFYLHIIGSFFRITVFPLIDRVIVHTLFQDHVINEYIDNIIAIAAATLWLLFSINNNAVRYTLSIAYGGTGIILAVVSADNIIFDVFTLLSLPLIASVALYFHKQQKKKILNFSGNLVLRYLSLAVIAIGVITIVISILFFFIDPDFSKSIARDSYANELFLLLSSFSAIYIFLLASCLGVKFLFRVALKKIKLNFKEEIMQTPSGAYEQKRLKTQTKIGILLLAMILSVVLVLIPQHPFINKDNQDVGVDTSSYVNWVLELSRSKNVSEFMFQAFVSLENGGRPLSLIFLFLVYQVSGSNNLSEVIEHSPLILGPGIVLAFYFLTLELTRNEKIALIAAFLGAISFHTLIGIYAGFYANWLGLIVGYVSMAFLFRYLRSGRLFDIAAFSTLLIGVLFIHIHTWTVLAAVSGTFLVVILLLLATKWKNSNFFTKRRIIWLLLAVLLSVVVDISKVSLIGSSGGLERDIGLAQANIGIEELNTLWNTLNAAVHNHVGGVFSNFIILLLGLFWVLKSKMREPSTVFLIIFLSAAILPVCFGNATLQVRVFYNIPFEIPAAIALYYISTRSGTILMTLAACTWLVAISLVTVMNYYFVWRPGIQ
jgi:hypothetical protein